MDLKKSARDEWIFHPSGFEGSRKGVDIIRNPKFNKVILLTTSTLIILFC